MQLCLVDHQIRRMMELGEIVNGDPGNVQPASLDLTVGTMAHQVMASVLPGAGNTVLDVLDERLINDLGLIASSVLQVGCTYIVRLNEGAKLPENIYSVANPKSSTGRLGAHVRLLADYCTRYDSIPAGYAGPLYVEITPLVFPIAIRLGDSLIQIRFMQVDTHANPLSLPPIENLTVDLSLSPSCYRAKRCTGVIDIDDKDFYDVAQFWERVQPRDNQLVLEPGQFYILASQEKVVIPNCCAAELAPYDPTLGEFRVHFAGFFDPGFIARAVLEVRPHTTPFIIAHGQTLASLQYVPLAAKPDVTYGPKIGSHYQGQNLKLSKHFKLA